MVLWFHIVWNQLFCACLYFLLGKKKVPIIDSTSFLGIPPPRFFKTGLICRRLSCLFPFAITYFLKAISNHLLFTRQVPGCFCAHMHPPTCSLHRLSLLLLSRFEVILQVIFVLVCFFFFISLFIYFAFSLYSLLLYLQPFTASFLLHRLRKLVLIISFFSCVRFVPLKSQGFFCFCF